MASHTLWTSILFWVSVPVLSVQMTSVLPNVSIALNRLTRPPRLARSATPTARASVIVGSNPSGTLATSRPMAKIEAWVQDKPASTPKGRNATPTPMATAAISHATLRTCCSRGLGSVRARPLRVAIRPSSVDMPVCTTRASASPEVHVVPESTTSEAR